VAVADYQEHVYTHAGAFADIPVTLRAKATQLPAMVQGFADLGAAIDACEHWYGPYAYGRVGYALTTDGALEIPTNVAYPQHMTGQSAASNRKLYTHELGHHWWGDQVTPRVHNDMWLKEGPAEYSAHLLEEWLFGRTAMVNMVKNNLLSIMTSAHLNDGGFQALSPMPDPYIYGTHTYYKGAAVLHNLRGYMGDEAFRQGMHAAQVALAGTDITPEQLRDALEEATGVDLHPFFEDQVRHPGYSVFEVRSLAAQPSSGGYTVELHIGQKLYGTDHYHADVPLDLTLLAPHGQVHELRVMAGGPSTALQVQCPFAPEMAVLNRYHRLNQAHMETEVVLLPGEAFSNYPEWVDFALFANTLTDTTLVRFDHIWSGADQAPLGNGIVQVSGRHYWNVDGLWPEGTSLRGRVLYQGTAPTEFDYELIGGDETGMALVYRRTADEPWQVYPDQAVNAGSLTNGIGSITVDPLRKGQYAFAKVTGTIGIAEPAPEGFSLWPMPAADRVELRLAEPLEEQAIARLHDAMGRLVAEQALPAGIVRTAIEPLPETAGAYRLSIALRSGRLVGERPLMVVR
jgi:aminopeptidase N